MLKQLNHRQNQAEDGNPARGEPEQEDRDVETCHQNPSLIASKYHYLL
jgi:hypothetical protein